MSMSRHYFEGEQWQPGKDYAIELTDLTELTMEARLDGSGDESGKTIDLLAGMIPHTPAQDSNGVQNAPAPEESMVVVIDLNDEGGEEP